MKTPEKSSLGLIKKCDIWVENLVWIEKMGITDEMIREANPKIVIVHVSGFGRPQFGGIPEVCDRPSFDVIGQAYSGFMSVQGEEGEMYPITKPTLNDYHTALFAALGALAAYIRARRTGKGDVVDVAQFEADAALLGHFMVSYTVSGELPKRTGNAFTNAPYDLYETGDGRYVAMGTLGKPLYNRALEVMGFDTEEYPFEECGVEDEKLQNFDEQYELAAGEKSALVASNITNTRKFEIKTPDVVIHVAPDRAELVETRIIDGRKCLVIPMESEIELNGIRVSTLNSVEDTSAEPLPVNDITDIDNSNTEEEIPF